MPSNPETFNKHRTDEIMRAAACKAAQEGSKLLDDSSLTVYDRLRDLGVFIRGCAEAMLWDDDNNGDSYDPD